MKKLAIISSYHEMCGIANYTERLEPVFKEYYEVTVLPLQTEVLNSNERALIALGDKLIDDIAHQVSEFDLVNIQFEMGLFGPSFEIVYKRVTKILLNCKNVIFTFHSVNFSGARYRLTKHPIRELITYFRERRPYHFYDKIVKQLMQIDRCDGKKANIIVHDAKTKRYIERIYAFEHVYDHPLGLANRAVRERSYNESEAIAFRKRYNMQADEKCIGVFGFVSEYKGHLVALKALNKLPPNYKLLVFGEQHPASIKPFVPVEPYLERLLDYLESADKKKRMPQQPPLSDRVVFAGGISDEEFDCAMKYCDFVVLPYLEVKQMGSGVAALAIENHAKVLMSNTKCFHELKQYYPDCFDSFDIGNYQQLAYMIEHYNDCHEEAISKALSVHNLENNVKMYVDIFER